MTAIADPPPIAVDPPPAPAPAFALPKPVATITADLLPDEVLVKRRLGYLKRRLVFVMAALVALVVLGDLLVRQQTSSAQDDLAAANNHIAALDTQLDGFSGVISTKSETQAIWTQLDGVMGDDVSWLALLNELVEPAPSGIQVALTAHIDDPFSTTGSSSADPTSLLVPDQIGSLTLTGTAPSWRAVATYVRGLSAVRGFAAVTPSTVSHGGSVLPGSGPTTGTGVNFTITLDLTGAALSNRYTGGGGSSTDAPSSEPATTFPADPAVTSTTSGAAKTTATVGAQAGSGTAKHHSKGTSGRSRSHTGTSRTGTSRTGTSRKHAHHGAGDDGDSGPSSQETS